MCTYVFMGEGCMHTCMYAGEQQRSTLSVSIAFDSLPTTPFWDKFSQWIWSLLIRLDGEISKRQGPSWLCLPTDAEIKGMCHSNDFCMLTLEIWSLRQSTNWTISPAAKPYSFIKHTARAEWWYYWGDGEQLVRRTASWLVCVLTFFFFKQSLRYHRLTLNLICSWT